MMRTLLVAMAFIVAASVVYAQTTTGEVYSLNVVGFQKVSVLNSAKKFSINSVPFDGTNANINSVVGNQLTGGVSYDTADDIMMWDATTQGYKLFWMAGNVGDANYNYKWIDNQTGEVATNINVFPGQGFWIRSRQVVTQTVVFAGDVPDGTVVTQRIVRGYQLVSFPYASQIYINATRLATNGALGGVSYDTSDDIMKWDQQAQTYKLYWLAGNVGDPGYNYHWMDNATSEVATNTYLQPGEGFWYRHRGSGFSWVEPKPYTVP